MRFILEKNKKPIDIDKKKVEPENKNEQEIPKEKPKEIPYRHITKVM